MLPPGGKCWACGTHVIPLQPILSIPSGPLGVVQLVFQPAYSFLYPPMLTKPYQPWSREPVTNLDTI